MGDLGGEQWLWQLCLERVRGLGWVGVRQGVLQYGGLEAFWRALELSCLVRGDIEREAWQELEQMNRMGVELVDWREEAFPQLLQEVADGPLWLRWMGQGQRVGKRLVAMVGSRKCSGYGREMARRLASDLVREGYVVVSGLAYGIDQVAHQAALEAGGSTMAVWGSGLGVQSQSRQSLVEEIGQVGGHWSQFSFTTSGTAYTFPLRNKVIAGMSLATVVVEAGEGSGSLLTAAAATKYGRPVLVVPHSAMAAGAIGGLRLLQQGAEVVLDGTDIVQKLQQLTGDVVGSGVDRGDQSDRDRSGLTEMEQDILGRLQLQPQSADALVRQTGWTTGEVGGCLGSLELQGWVELIEEEYVAI